MNMTEFWNKVIATAIFLGCFGIGAFSMADTSDARRLGETKVTLSQAIDAAQKETGGVAYEASLDDDSFTPTYEVNVAKDGKSYDVRVDAVTGKVTGTREDLDD